jgi:hypothetical protein
MSRGSRSAPACALVLAALLVAPPRCAAQARPADAELFASVKTGDIAKVRALISGGAAVDISDRRGRTPLIWAAAGGNVALIGELLERGAAVDRASDDGMSALMVAASNGFTESARALIVRGANVAANANGVTARQLAVARGHAETAALLEQAEALGRRLLLAASEGNDTLVRQVLAMGAPFNVTDERGATALMIAARNGDLGIMQTLLSRGADAAVRDRNGQTVFEWAEPSPSTAKYVVAFLTDRGVTRQPSPRTTPPPSPQVVASLRQLAAVLGRIPPASPPLQTAQRRATAALSQLQRLSVKWPAESPGDYRDNLAAYVAALEAALKAGDVERLTDMVETAAEDLEIKLEHCVQSGGKLGGSVLVRVRTLQGAAESKSWQVFYMPRVFEAAANASPDLFPQLSSPTEELLVPGRYVMWVRDPATARLGERTVVKVGEGKKELLLDLPVPLSQP